VYDAAGARLTILVEESSLSGELWNSIRTNTRRLSCRLSLRVVLGGVMMNPSVVVVASGNVSKNGGENEGE
jgi:hypothetical protein